ncbi:hypothetical protein F4859DRAFT_477027 [Xylaria cf. heliscus]|nr:hypothetical protein F4859DRAFT_477027 [Xylaria cf. heliscus]
MMAQAECPTLVSRAPTAPPIDSSHNRRQFYISFRHPTYTTNDLLCLGAVDCETAPGIYMLGVSYDVALAACGIVACNRWHQAWFGEKCDDQNGNSWKGGYRCVPRPEDGILPYKKTPYYFFINQDTFFQYPVVPCFDGWLFPHGDLPEAWKRLYSQSNAGDTATAPAGSQHTGGTKDQRCSITGDVPETEAAHLIPAEAIDWFKANDMQQYCRNQAGQPASPIEDQSNILFLRKDLHSLFNRRRFSIVPRNYQLTPTSTTSPAQPGSPVVYFLLPDGHSDLYQNHPLQPFSVRDVAPEFLFARFAWDIIRYDHYRLIKTFPLSSSIFKIPPVSFTLKRKRGDSSGSNHDDNSSGSNHDSIEDYDEFPGDPNDPNDPYGHYGYYGEMDSEYEQELEKEVEEADGYFDQFGDEDEDEV